MEASAGQYGIKDILLPYCIKDILLHIIYAVWKLALGKPEVKWEEMSTLSEASPRPRAGHSANMLERFFLFKKKKMKRKKPAASCRTFCQYA